MTTPQIIFAQGWDFASTTTNDVISIFDYRTSTGSGIDNISTSTITPFNKGKSLAIYSSHNTILQKNFQSNAINGIGFSSYFYQLEPLYSNLWMTISDGDTPQFTVGFMTNGTVQIYSGGSTNTLLNMINGNNSNPVYTKSSVFSPSTWFSVQMLAVFGTGTSGSVHIRLNGSNIDTVAATGISTQSSGNASASSVGFGTSSAGYAANVFYLDSTVFSNGTSWCPEAQIIPQYVDTSIQSIFTVVNAATNWQAVSNGTSKSSYIQSGNVGDEDIFSLGNSIATNLTVMAVNQVMVAEKSDAGARTVTLSVNTNGSGDTPTANFDSVGPSWGFSTAILNADPTGAPWTPSSVNSAQIGVKISL